MKGADGMTINPITLSKLEPVVIRSIEYESVDRIIHQVKEVSLQKQGSSDQSFSPEAQEHALKELRELLAAYGLKLEYKLERKRTKIKIKLKDDTEVSETECEDAQELLEKIKSSKGTIIDVKR